MTLRNMAESCENEGAFQVLFFMVLAPISFIVWILIGLVYLVDKRLSIPPGKLIAAEVFSYMLNEPRKLSSLHSTA
jgi:hypothetical protein